MARQFQFKQLQEYRTACKLFMLVFVVFIFSEPCHAENQSRSFNGTLVINGPMQLTTLRAAQGVPCSATQTKQVALTILATQGVSVEGLWSTDDVVTHEFKGVHLRGRQTATGRFRLRGRERAGKVRRSYTFRGAFFPNGQGLTLYYTNRVRLKKKLACVYKRSSDFEF